MSDVRVCTCTARVRAFWCRRGRVRVHVHDHLVTHGCPLRGAMRQCPRGLDDVPGCGEFVEPVVDPSSARAGGRDEVGDGESLFFRLAARPCSRITAATVFLLTAQPSSRRSAVIRGEPYFPPCAANSLFTSALSWSCRCARDGSAPSSCL